MYIGGCVSLKYLYLNNNNLESLPKTIGNLTQLGKKNIYFLKEEVGGSSKEVGGSPKEEGGSPEAKSELGRRVC